MKLIVVMKIDLVKLQELFLKQEIVLVDFTLMIMILCSIFFNDDY